MQNSLKFILFSALLFGTMNVRATHFTTRPDSPLAVTTYNLDVAELKLIKDIEARSELVFSGQTEMRDGARIFYFKPTEEAANRILLFNSSTDKIQSDLQTLHSVIELKGHLKIFSYSPRGDSFSVYFPEISKVESEELSRLTGFKTEFIPVVDRFKIVDVKKGLAAELYPNQLDLAIEEVKSLGAPEIVTDARGLMDAFKFKASAENSRLEKAKKALKKAFCEHIF